MVSGLLSKSANEVFFFNVFYESAAEVSQLLVKMNIDCSTGRIYI